MEGSGFALNQLLVLTVFVSTIVALIFSDKRPSYVFSVAALVLLLFQQLTFEQLLGNLTNLGLITLILLLMVSSAVDKTSVIKRLGRTLVNAKYNQSFIRIFGLTFFSSALLNKKIMKTKGRYESREVK